MHLKHFRIFSLLLLGVFFVSCSSVSERTTSEMEPVPNNTNKSSLTMLTSYQPLLSGAGTNSGFYYIEPRPNDILTGNIRYVDYENAIDIALSSQVNAEPFSSNDSSYLDSIIGESVLLSHKDQLIFLRGGAPSYAADDNFGERALSAVYSMELSGANRSCIYLGDSTSILLPTAFADDEFLYCFRQTMKEIELIKISFSGKKEAVLATFPFGTQFIGVWGRELMIQSIEDMRTDANHTTNYAISAFDIDTQNQKPVISWNSEKLVYAAVNQDAIYLMNVNTGILERYSLQGEQTNYDLTEYIADTSFVCNSVTSFGSYLFIPYYNELSDHYFSISVDTKDFSMYKNTIPYYDEEKGTTYDAKVIAETDQYFLVITNSAMKNAQLDFGDGTNTSVSMPIYQMALFTKSDYLSSQNISQQIVRSE